MKKFLSMTLAILMIATLGLTAFAADTFYPDQVVGDFAKQDGAYVAFFADDGVVDLGSAKLVGGSYDNTVYFGENMYLAFVNEDAAADEFIDKMEADGYTVDYPLINVFNAVKNMKVSFYSLSEDAQEFLGAGQIVRKKVIYSTEPSGTVEGISDDADDNSERCLINNAISNYAYFYEIPVKDYKKLNADDKLFSGALKLKVSKGDYSMEIDKTDFCFVPAQHSIEDGAYETDVIYEDAKYYPADMFDANDTEYTFTFDFEDPTNSAFVVDMSKQRRDIKLGVDDDVTEAEYRVLMNEDNTLDFEFFNFEQVGIFSKIGTLYLYWNDEDSNVFTYQIAEDGTLFKLVETEAVYQDEKSDYPGCVAIKTNKLGRYLLTDKELNINTLNPANFLNYTNATVPEKVVVTIEKEVIKEVPVEVEKIVEKEVIKEVPVKESNTASMIAVAVIALVVGAAAIYMLFTKEVLTVTKTTTAKKTTKKTETK